MFNIDLLHEQKNEWKEVDVKFCGSEEWGDDIAAEYHCQGLRGP